MAVLVNNKSILDITSLSVSKACEFFDNIKFNEKEKIIAKAILKEIKARLSFLNNVGLGYLNLDRESSTLSGGEAQRIHLATQIGSGLTGVLYVLDEPSIGLHQKDNNKLLQTLITLRDLGNTLIVVEHDEDTMRQSDYLIDLGPGAGIHGGKIVAEGTIDEVLKNNKSLTAQYLNGQMAIPVPKKEEKQTVNGCLSEEPNNLILKKLMLISRSAFLYV